MTGAEYLSGTGKKYQLEKFGETGFQRFFNFEKVDRGKFIILDIYQEPLNIIDLRQLGNARGIHKVGIKQECFKVSTEDAIRPGVYKIENDKYIYIGSTVNRLTRRFGQHYHNQGGTHSKTQAVLMDGGSFTCLQSFDFDTDEQTIRECEAEYIKKYLNTDKILLNEKLPETFSKEEKIKYKTFRVPEEMFEDVKKYLDQNGYLIMDNILFNKKFVDDD